MSQLSVDGEFKCGVATMILSYICMTYIGACVVYLVATRFVDTPFSDTLTEEQKSIKKESAMLRKKIFFAGILVTLLVLGVTRPFHARS